MVVLFDFLSRGKMCFCSTWKICNMQRKRGWTGKMKICMVGARGSVRGALRSKRFLTVTVTGPSQNCKQRLKRRHSNVPSWSVKNGYRSTTIPLVKSLQGITLKAHVKTHTEAVWEIAWELTSSGSKANVISNSIVKRETSSYTNYSNNNFVIG